MNFQLKGRKQQEEIQKQNGKSVNEKINHSAHLRTALIKARQENSDPFLLLETVMPLETFLGSVEESKNVFHPKNYDSLDLLESRYNYLRKYTPTSPRVLKFRAIKYANAVLIALDTTHKLNESGKRKELKGCPLRFVSKRWERYLYDEEESIN